MTNTPGTRPRPDPFSTAGKPLTTSSSGADIKTVQARLRHATAQTTLDTYGHLWPDADESTRAAVGKVIAARLETPADALRTIEP